MPSLSSLSTFSDAGISTPGGSIVKWDPTKVPKRTNPATARRPDTVAAHTSFVLVDTTPTISLSAPNKMPFRTCTGLPPSNLSSPLRVATHKKPSELCANPVTDSSGNPRSTDHRCKDASPSGYSRGKPRQASELTVSKRNTLILRLSTPDVRV